MVAVAMVRVSDVLLCLGMLTLPGCVVSHEPDVANALDVPIEVILRYADGEIMNVPFEPGFRMRIGARSIGRVYSCTGAKAPR